MGINDTIQTELERKRTRMQSRIEAYLLQKKAVFAQLETEPPPSWSSHLAEQMFQFFVPIDRAFGNRRMGVNEAEKKFFNDLDTKRDAYLKDIENASSRQQHELFLDLETEIFNVFIPKMIALIDQASRIQSRRESIQNRDEY
jgi:hypothetical protein